MIATVLIVASIANLIVGIVILQRLIDTERELDNLRMLMLDEDRLHLDSDQTHFPENPRNGERWQYRGQWFQYVAAKNAWTQLDEEF